MHLIFLCAILGAFFVQATPSNDGISEELVPCKRCSNLKDCELQDQVVVGNNTYFFTGARIFMNAAEASLLCAAQEMRLLSIETEEKWIELAEFIDEKGCSGKTYWTSGIKFEDLWVWGGSGKQFTYTSWFDSQPDNVFEGRDICVHFTSNQGWFDDRCSETFGFICEF